MTRRLSLLIPLAAGTVIGSFVPGLPDRVRTAFVSLSGSGAAQSQEQERPQGPDPRTGTADDKKDKLTLAPDQISGAGIDVATVQSGVLAQRIIVPGSIIPDADRQIFPIGREKYFAANLFCTVPLAKQIELIG